LVFSNRKEERITEEQRSSPEEEAMIDLFSKAKKQNVAIFIFIFYFVFVANRPRSAAPSLSLSLSLSIHSFFP
jgi:hypothetical protein